MARIISGTETSRTMRAEIAQKVTALAAEGIVPGLSVVLVGDDPASEVYVRSKTQACAEVGMRGRTRRFPAEIEQDELFGVIDGLNADPDVHGILVQLPIPEHLSYKAVLERIHPDKDVDGFHPLDVGRAFVGDPTGFIPATPAGIMELIRREKIP